MRLRFLGVLDRYVLKQWFATFLLSAVGVPAVAVIIDLAERFGKLSAERHIPTNLILLGQLYLFPQKMAILFPAAVLFATVFTLNAMGRHSELTAVQGAGVSFYRLIAPMLILATLAVPADYELQELAGYSTTRQKELHKDKFGAADDIPRYAFPYESDSSGWTWAISELRLQTGRVGNGGILGESPIDTAGLRWMIAADSAAWDIGHRQWRLIHGTSYLLADSTVLATLRFQSMRLPRFTEPPAALMKEDKKAEEMTTPELRSYLARLKKSGARPGTLAVELPLKYAVPMACLIVALFGAPLAITNARAGAAVGLAIALGTTLAYLTGTQIMKAIGGRELIGPELAAWSMNIVFLTVAVILLAKVKS